MATKKKKKWVIKPCVTEGGMVVLNGPLPIAEACRFAKLFEAAPALLAAAKAAVENCRCSLKERMSGHHVDCNAPALEVAIAQAEE